MPKPNFIAASEYLNEKIAVDPTGPQRRLWSIEGTRNRLGGVGNTLIYSKIATGELIAVKLGSRTFVTGDSLDALIDLLPRADIHTGQRKPVLLQRQTRSSRTA